MRIAVVTDIHGNLAALQAVVQDLQRRGVDQVINLGDSVSGPLLPLQTARYLMASGWLHLAGNHERQVLTQGPGQWSAADAYAHAQLGSDELAWMATLQPNLPWRDGIHLCHASPRSDLEYLLDTRRARRRAPGFGRRGARAPGRRERRAGAVRPQPPSAHRAHGHGAADRQPRQRGPAGLRRRASALACHRERRARCALCDRRARARPLAGLVAGRALRPRVDGPAGRAARPERLGARAAHRLHAPRGRRPAAARAG